MRLKYLNFGVKLALLFVVIIYCLMIFFFYRVEVSDNYHDYPSITTKPWAIKNMTMPYKNLAYWDGAWYLHIAEFGYSYNPDVQSNVVFFPLYPLALRLAHVILPIPWALLGSLLSSLFLIIACGLLFEEVKSRWGEDIAKNSLWYLLIFPSAVFFSLVYTESLFLLCAVATFFFMRQKNWALVGVFGCLLALTKVVGVLILIAAIIEFWQSEHKFNKRAWWLTLIPVGLLLVMLYDQSRFHDALAFLHGQENFFRANFSYQTFRNMLAIPPVGADRAVLLVEAGSAAMAIIAGLLAFKWLRPSYAIYVILGVLVPLFSGTWQSMSRYVLVLFPVFIVAAVLGKKNIWFHYLYVMVMPALLAMNIIQFIHFAWAG